METNEKTVYKVVLMGEYGPSHGPSEGAFDGNEKEVATFQEEKAALWFAENYKGFEPFADSDVTIVRVEECVETEDECSCIDCLMEAEL